MERERQRKEKERAKENEKKQKEEERMKKKIEKEEAKIEQQQKKDEEKKQKEEEKRQKDEEKRKQEEAEKEKQRKAAALFKGFFVQGANKGTEEAGGKDGQDKSESGLFTPFMVKKNMRMAPLVRGDSKSAKINIDRLCMLHSFNHW